MASFTTRLTLLPREGFVVSPVVDLACLILSPVIGLVIIQSIVLSEAQWFLSPQPLFGIVDSRIGFAIAVWTYGHLFAVLFRSHLNADIFELHRVRFTVVPTLVFIGLVISPWALAVGVALAWFWDVYHSSMQIFGFCRIYDSRLGNPSTEGRQLDLWMSHLVYIAPIFLGLNLRPMLELGLIVFEPLGLDLTPSITLPIALAQNAITIVLLFAAPTFVVYYVLRFRALAEQGYRYSPQKAMLLLTTGAVPFYAWMFLPLISALFIVNFFHALQYFAMVWSSEKRNISRVFGLSRFAFGHIAALSIFLTIIFAEGVWVKANATYGGGVIAISIGTLISLMHFWYDGFIWSVRQRQV